MKKLVPIIILCLTSYVGVSQFEVKISPHPANTTRGFLGVEYIKNDSIGYEVQWMRDWTFSLDDTISTNTNELYFIRKKYSNSSEAGNTFYAAPFVKLGVENSTNVGESRRDWVSAAFGYLFGYKHVFPMGLTFEPTIDLNIGARYGFPDPNSPLIRNIDRTSLITERTFRFWLGYRFGGKKLAAKRDE